MEKIKHFWGSEEGKDILVIIIIILLGLASFELGRLSKSDRRGGIEIEYPEILNEAKTEQGASVILAGEAPRVATPTILGKAFFASNRGQKYYSVGCAGGKTIKQENRIYFNSAAEAESAGYEKSDSCK